MNQIKTAAKIVLLIEISFMIAWRFAGYAPSPIPLGNPLLIGIISLSFFIPTRVHRKNWREVGLTKHTFKKKYLAQSLLMGAALGFIGFLVLIPGLEFLTGEEFDRSFFERIEGNIAMLFAAIGASLLYAGIGEEMIYRGFLLDRLNDLIGGKEAGTILAVLLSAGVFGLAHSYQGIVGILSSGVIGLILGLLYVRFDRNLWVVILVHATIDVIAAVIIFLGFF